LGVLWVRFYRDKKLSVSFVLRFRAPLQLITKLPLSKCGVIEKNKNFVLAQEKNHFNAQSLLWFF
jgi:hypothetical protein